MKLSCEIPLSTLDSSSTQKNPLDAHSQSVDQEMSSPFGEPCHYRVHTFSTQVPTNTRFQTVEPEDVNDSSLK